MPAPDNTTSFFFTIKHKNFEKKDTAIGNALPMQLPGYQCILINMVNKDVSMQGIILSIGVEMNNQYNLTDEDYSS